MTRMTPIFALDIVPCQTVLCESPQRQRPLFYRRSDAITTGRRPSTQLVAAGCAGAALPRDVNDSAFRNML